MKLSEVLINKRTVKYDKSLPSGNRWLVVDESTNRIIEKHSNKVAAYKSINLDSAPQLIFEEETPTRALGNFRAGEIFDLGRGRVGIGLDSSDEIIEFMSGTQDQLERPVRSAITGATENSDRAMARARSFLENLPEADRSNPDRLRTAARNAGRGVQVLNISEWTRSLTRRAAQASATTWQALENIPRVGPTLRNVLQSPAWRGFGRMAAGGIFAGQLIFSALEIINDLENEADDDPNLLERNMELRDIVVAQVSVQVLFYLYQIMRNASLFNRALRYIKWTVRAIQGGMAVSGIGTIPGVLSFLITEAGWLVAGWIITSPTVQRSLAEWLHGTLMGALLGFVGGGLVAASTVLDAALDGQFGSGALRRGLGWARQDPAEAPEGEYTSTSEWAKLVFHGLLFPPGREQMLVPYIPPEQRASLLSQAMGLQEAPTSTEQPNTGDQPAPAEEPVPTSEPGLPTNPDARPGPQ